MVHPTVYPAVYINLVVHLVLVYSFIYVAGLAIINRVAPDGASHESEYGPGTTAWCGFSALIVGFGVLMGWLLFLTFPGGIPLENRSASWWLHMGFGITSAIMLLVAATAIFKHWQDAGLLYLIAVGALLTSNFFPLVPFRYEGTPQTFYFVSLAIGVFLLLLFGVGMSAKDLQEPKKT